MTLTEQWKKGELPEGFYYVSDGAEVTIDYYLCDYWERHFDGYVQQILTPVPSYEEYMTMKDCAKMVFEAAERETKLKELLKECIKTIEDGWMYHGIKTTKAEEMMTKIYNAIGEKK